LVQLHASKLSGVITGRGADENGAGQSAGPVIARSSESETLRHLSVSYS